MIEVFLKRYFFVLVVIGLCFTLIACEGFQMIVDENEETPFVDLIQSKLPIIYIDTNSLAIQSHETYTPCDIKITKTGEAYLMDDANAGIRLRGHSTSQFDKKPYRIRFDEEVQPLGLGTGPSRSWVLLSEYVDISMLRNYVTYNIAEELLRSTFVPDIALVEVVLNDAHLGIYALTEQVHINDERIDIDEEGTASSLITDTGYLLETEADSERRNGEGVEGVDWITVPGYTNTSVVITWQNAFYYDLLPDVAFYVIKSDAKSIDQIAFIRNYLKDTYDAIYVNQTFEVVDEYIDINSAVDMYLLQLITNDMDYNFSSNYVYKDKAGKIVFGPPWDHDLCYGNHYQNTSPEDLHIFHLLYELSTISWFQDLVVARYDEITSDTYDIYQDMREMINGVTLEYQSELSRNHEIWAGTRRTDGWHVIYVQANSQEQAAQTFLAWIEQRKVFVESYLVNWS